MNKKIIKILGIIIVITLVTTGITIAERSTDEFIMSIDNEHAIGGQKDFYIYVNGSWAEDIFKIYFKVFFDNTKINYVGRSFKDSVIPSGASSWSKIVKYNETESSIALKASKNMFSNKIKAGSGNLIIFKFDILESVPPSTLSPPDKTYFNFSNGAETTGYYLNKSWNYPTIPTLKNGTLSLTPNSIPLKPSDPVGPSEGSIEIDETFSASSIDPDDGQIQYAWDWGDGSSIEWSDFYDSGVTMEITKNWSSSGIYFYKVKARDIHGMETEWSNTSKIIIYENRPPETPETPTGPAEGKVDLEYTFTTSTTDPEGDEIKYGWNFTGGNTVDEWTDFYPSGSTAEVTHSFTNLGTYEIKVKARDIGDLESDWSDTMTIEITNSPPEKPNTPTGPSHGKINYYYQFETDPVIDPDGDTVFYNFSFGDGNYSGWQLNPIGFHSWANNGIYNIKVKVKDDKGAESDWSESHQITISEGIPELIIDSIYVQRNQIVAVIRNIGDAEATSTSWEISIEGGIKIFVENSTGTIESIPAGDVEEVTLKGKILFGIGLGFGRIKDLPTITVNAKAENSDPVEDSVSAKIIFKKVII